MLVDYNQNAWGRTLASIYSVRPQPKATVSTPITWKELQQGVRIEDFRIDNVRERIKKVGDLWAPLLADTGRAKLESLVWRCPLVRPTLLWKTRHVPLDAGDTKARVAGVRKSDERFEHRRISIDDSPSGRKFWAMARFTFASGHPVAKKSKSLSVAARQTLLNWTPNRNGYFSAQ